MKVLCSYCQADFDWQRGTMNVQCPKCGRKLKPTDVLMHDEFERPDF